MWTASLAEAGKQVEGPNDFCRIKSWYRINWDWEVQWATLPWLTITILKTVDVFLKTQFAVCCQLFHLDPIHLNYVPKCRQTIKPIVKTRPWKTKKTLILSLPCSFFNCYLWSLYVTAKSISLCSLRYFEGYFTHSFSFLSEFWNQCSKCILKNRKSTYLVLSIQSNLQVWTDHLIWNSSCKLEGVWSLFQI